MLEGSLRYALPVRGARAPSMWSLGGTEGAGGLGGLTSVVGKGLDRQGKLKEDFENNMDEVIIACAERTACVRVHP